jgi:hypothetical protein
MLVSVVVHSLVCGHGYRYLVEMRHGQCADPQEIYDCHHSEEAHPGVASGELIHQLKVAYLRILDQIGSITSLFVVLNE